MEDLDACLFCSPGTEYADRTSCTVCPAGKTQVQHNASAASCAWCPNGRYNTDEGTSPDKRDESEDCLPCLTGRVFVSQSAACSTCPFGRYQDELAQTECKACPFGHVHFRPSVARARRVDGVSPHDEQLQRGQRAEGENTGGDNDFEENEENREAGTPGSVGSVVSPLVAERQEAMAKTVLLLRERGTELRKALSSGKFLLALQSRGGGSQRRRTGRARRVTTLWSRWREIPLSLSRCASSRPGQTGVSRRGSSRR